MFRYAAAASMFKHFKLTYMLSNIGSLKYFKLTRQDYIFNFFKVNYLVWIFLKLIRAKKIDFTSGWNYQNYADQLMNLNGNYMIRGCLAHPSFFFKDYESVGKYFEVKKKYRQRFDSLSRELFNGCKIVVIHVRRGDYGTFQVEGLGDTDMTLPVSYYRKVVSIFDKNEIKYIFLSDDIVQVKKDFGYLENAFFSQENEITDMLFLMNADVCVLSCSTFSWWGAVLNKKPGKVVYAPKYFLGFKVAKEYPEDIIPDDWIKVDVFGDDMPPVSSR
jgi:hypothetical protein